MLTANERVSHRVPKATRLTIMTSIRSALRQNTFQSLPAVCLVTSSDLVVHVSVMDERLLTY